MFNLNQAIGSWRASLGARPGIQELDLVELEDHLREQVSELCGVGLSEEEAFLVATRRLGFADDLSGEFEIADPARRRNFRLTWMIAGILAMGAVWIGSQVLTNLGAGLAGALRFPAAPGSGPVSLGILLNLVKIGFLVLGGVVVWRLLASDRSARRIRNLSGGAVIALAFFLAAGALVTRIGSQALVARTFPLETYVGIATAGAWTTWAMLLALPVILLAGLWKLIRTSAPG